MSIYVFDLDGTLCETLRNPQGYWEYKTAIPKLDRIAAVNNLFHSGNQIIIETARGCNSGEDWHEFTRSQLENWGLNFHILRAGVKFAADYYIDDKAINVKDWLQQ